MRRLLLLLGVLLAAFPALALTPQQARALVVGETEDRIAALNKVLEGAAEKTVALIQALSDDAVKFTDSAVFVMNDGKGHDPDSGAELAVPDAAEDAAHSTASKSSRVIIGKNL